MNPVSQAPATTHVWLIHGTWAREAAWTDAGSVLRTGLVETLGSGLQFHTFAWSGRNRSFDRFRASRELTKAVGSTLRPGERAVAVAHSHGGNIVIDALRANQRLFSDIVTLNTPFFSLLPRHEIVVFVHAMLLLVGLGFLPAAYLHSSVVREIGMRLVAVAILLCVGLALYGAHSMRPSRDAAYGGDEPHDFDAAMTGQAHVPPAHVLCVTTADDEAFGWLETLDVLINLPYLLLHRLAFPVTFVGLAISHWIWRWDFGRSSIEYAQLWQHMRRLLDTGDVMDALGSTLTWIPPALSHDAVHAVSIRVWEHAPGSLLYTLFAFSVMEYYLTYWCGFAVFALIFGMALRMIAFGEGLNLDTVQDCFTTRLKTTLTPLDVPNSRLLIEDFSEGVVLHSALHSSDRVAATIGRQLLVKAAERRGRE